MTQEIIVALPVLKLLKSQAFKLSYALINIHITQGTKVHPFKAGSILTTPPLEISYRRKASLAWSERKDGQQEQVSQAERETWPQRKDLKHPFPLWSLGRWQFDKMWHEHTYKWAKTQAHWSVNELKHERNDHHDGDRASQCRLPELASYFFWSLFFAFLQGAGI